MQLITFVMLSRLWVLITNAQPMRAWMFDGGLVVFSAQKQEVGMSEEQLRGLGFNLWTQDRSKTVVWRCASGLAPMRGR